MSTWDKFMANKPTDESMKEYTKNMIEESFAVGDKIQGLINSFNNKYRSAAVLEGLFLIAAMHEELIDRRAKLAGIPQEERERAMVNAKKRAKMFAVKLNDDAMKMMAEDEKHR